MKILVISQNSPIPPIDATRIKVLDLLKRICKSHEVTLIFFDQAEYESSVLEEYGVTVEEVICIPFKPHRKIDALINIFEKTPYSFHQYGLGKKEILSHAKNTSYDLVHFDGINLAQFVSCFKADTPKVISPNDCLSLNISRELDLKTDLLRRVYLALQRIKFKYVEKEIYKNFQKCWVMGEVDKQALLSLNPTLDIEAIPAPVDTDFYCPSLRSPDIIEKKRRKVISFLGAMDSPRNIDSLRFFLDKIWPLISNMSLIDRFNVVGSNPTPEVYTMCEVDDLINVTGTVDDIRDYVYDSQVIVCPLTYGTGRKIRVLQSMSMGKPVVTTSVGSENIPAESGVHFIVADDPLAFAQSVCSLLEDPDMAQEMGERAREFVISNSGIEAVMGKVELMYDSLVDRENSLGDM